MASPENNKNGGEPSTKDTQQQTSKDKSVLVGSNSSLTEAARGMFCGILYGVTSPLAGHPIDTVKTKVRRRSISMHLPEQHRAFYETLIFPDASANNLRQRWLDPDAGQNC